MQEKNYFVMLIDPPWAGPTTELVAGPAVETNNGVSIGPLIQVFDIRLVVDAKAPDPQTFPPCDIHGPTKRMLLSERAIKTLERVGVDNIEYFDARVTSTHFSKVPNYKVANIVGVVSGLDLAKSDVVMGRRNRVLAIEKMVFDESRLQPHKICRLQEDIMLMVVHKDIKDAIERQGLTGFRFVRDLEWTPGMI
jgi:hypothetical protein